LRPRRGDAPPEDELPRPRGKSREAADDERGRRQHPLDVQDEPVAAEVDATLRPLARALLALAEQLGKEGDR
jgi:hypothetical protein